MDAPALAISDALRSMSLAGDTLRSASAALESGKLSAAIDYLDAAAIWQQTATAMVQFLHRQQQTARAAQRG